jgi:hypothetical protein
VHQALVAVKRDLGAVGKTKRMEAGPAKYPYRGIDELLNRAHGPLCEHGVLFVPTVLDVLQHDVGTTRAGTAIVHTRLTVRFRVYGPRGDWLDVTTCGEAMDMSDKGTNKAATAAFKVALTTVLAVPFEGDDPDDEQPTVERDQAPPPKAPAQSKVQRALHASARKAWPDDDVRRQAMIDLAGVLGVEITSRKDIDDALAGRMLDAITHQLAAASTTNNGGPDD